MHVKDIPQFTRQGSWECNYSLDRLVWQIEEWEDEGLDMQPDFQRDKVWTEDQQVKFIEYILKGGVTGRVIYLNNDGWDHPNDNEQFVCVDGLQRVTALKRFVYNEIKAFDTYYKDFEGSFRMCHEMKINVNNLRTREEVLTWYLEMNSGGTPHTEAELDKVRKMLRGLK